MFLLAPRPLFHGQGLVHADFSVLLYLFRLEGNAPVPNSTRDLPCSTELHLLNRTNSADNPYPSLINQQRS